MRKRFLVLLALLFFVPGVAPTQAGPDEARERNELGVRLLKQGKAKEAILEFQKALKLKPDYATARLNLAYAYDLQGQVDEAMAEYEKAIELEPGNSLVHSNLGVLYDKKGLYDRAILEFEKAVQIDPTSATALANLERAKKSQAVVAERVQQLAQAKKEAEGYPKNPLAAYKLGRLHAFYGDKDQAIEWIMKALELGYDDFDYLKKDPALQGLRDDSRFIRLLPAR